MSSSASASASSSSPSRSSDSRARALWGSLFVAVGCVCFVAFAYAAVVSKLLPPSDNAIISAVQNDSAAVYTLRWWPILSTSVRIYATKHDPYFSISAVTVTVTIVDARHRIRTIEDDGFCTGLAWVAPDPTVQIEPSAGTEAM